MAQVEGGRNVSIHVYYVSDTSRQVCGGCGNSTVSKLAVSWEMRWDWARPSRSSAFWLDWAIASSELEGPTTGIHTHTVQRLCVCMVWIFDQGDFCLRVCIWIIKHVSIIRLFTFLLQTLEKTLTLCVSVCTCVSSPCLLCHSECLHEDQKWIFSLMHCGWIRCWTTNQPQKHGGVVEIIWFYSTNDTHAFSRWSFKTLVNTLSTIDAHKLIACKLNYGPVSITSTRQRFMLVH